MLTKKHIFHIDYVAGIRLQVLDLCVILALATLSYFYPFQQDRATVKKINGHGL